MWNHNLGRRTYLCSHFGGSSPWTLSSKILDNGEVEHHDGRNMKQGYFLISWLIGRRGRGGQWRSHGRNAQRTQIVPPTRDPNIQNVSLWVMLDVQVITVSSEARWHGPPLEPVLSTTELCTSEGLWGESRGSVPLTSALHLTSLLVHSWRHSFRTN